MAEPLVAKFMVMSNANHREQTYGVFTNAVVLTSRLCLPVSMLIEI